MGIVKKMDKTFLAEIGLRVNDMNYNDFDIRQYANAIYEAERRVARKYDLFERKLELEIQKPDLEKEIPLSTTELSGITMVLVNGIEYYPIADMLDELSREKVYSIWFNMDTKYWIFDMRPKVEKDIVEIYYTSTGLEKEEYEGVLLLPNKYHDEIIKNAIQIVCTWGIAKFNGEKLQKYNRLYQLYMEPKSQIDPKLMNETTWIKMKPYNLFD